MGNELATNSKSQELTGNNDQLLQDIRKLIEEARNSVAIAVNSAMTTLYWNIGQRINTDILKGKRADYGKEIVSTLSRQLVLEYGDGYSAKNLRHMMKFAEMFSDYGIVSTLSRQLSWSHFKEIIYMKDPLQVEFYAELCRVEGWSVRILRKQINSRLYERTVLSKKPDEVIKHELQQLHDTDQMTTELVFKDPYFLDFLGLNDRYLEKDLEDAILRELEQFLLELGYGFAFMARQKRIQIDNDDYYIDLLLYHRGLNRLIAIDLKLGDFKADYKGQMELYLRWLNKHERKQTENEPLGIILCAGKKQEMIELLELGKSGIHVAKYLTELPPGICSGRNYIRPWSVRKPELQHYRTEPIRRLLMTNWTDYSFTNTVKRVIPSPEFDRIAIVRTLSSQFIHPPQQEALGYGE